MEQSKALSKPDFRHILADINWEHGSHLVLAAKRSDSQGLLLKSVPFLYERLCPSFSVVLLEVVSQEVLANHMLGFRERKQKRQSIRNSIYLMAAKHIEKRLEQTLLHNGEMQYGLYEYELEEFLDELKSSLAEDNDDYIFAVTENSGPVAMVLIEKSGQVHINAWARGKLQALWPAAYESNLKQLIPAFAKQLNEGELPINGVKTVGQS